jgi:predicted acylesterase/phospholipase RssA
MYSDGGRIMQLGNRTALVISGGGAKGAFAVGVIANLHERFSRSGWFAIVGGSSAGALVAPFAALLGAGGAMGRDARETMITVATRVSTGDILGRRGPIGLLRHADALNVTGPLRRLLERSLPPAWFAWLQTPAAPAVYAVYTNYRTGEKVTVTARDPGMDRERFIASLVASASVPVFMEPALIDGDACFDGGVRDLLPCEPAIALGAETIVPIMLDPDDPPPAVPLGRLDRVLVRTIALLLHETGRNDLAQAEGLAAAGRVRRELAAAFADDPAALARIESVLERPANRPWFGRANRLANVVEGLRPDAPLTTDVLRFDPAEMRAWMEAGARKAAEVVRTSPFGGASAAREHGGHGDEDQRAIA